MELQSSDFLFIAGIVGTFVGAFAQDRMRRGLRAVGQVEEARARGARVARSYGRARQPHELEAWPLPVFYGGFALGIGCLAVALVMLLVA